MFSQQESYLEESKSQVDFEPLYQALEYTFKDPQLLQHALTRKSALKEGLGQVCNERFEFFGDSILRMVIDDLLLENYPQAGEGELSDKRDQLVSKRGKIYEIAEKLGLANYIIMGLGESHNFAEAGRNKILVDTMEAIIAAIFYDAERNYQFIRNFIEQHWFLKPIILDWSKQLFVAVKLGNLYEVNYCLQQNADPNALHEDRYGISCPCCLTNPKPLWLEVVRYARSPSTPLDVAIRRIHYVNHNTLAIVRALLHAGANPDEKSAFGYSVLHETIVYYPKGCSDANVYTGLMELLCCYGANLNLRHKAICHTSLGDSCRDEISDLVDEGFTPLELTIIFAKVEKLEILLRHGADPNLINCRGQNTLHLAALMSNYYIRYESNRKKWSNAFDEEYFPTNYRHVFLEIITKLINVGADSSLMDYNSHKPSDIANNPTIKQSLEKMQKIL